MEKDSLLTDLSKQFQNKDWFYDTGYDQYGRPVVYVKYECQETRYQVPDKFQGKQLLVHFAASVLATKDDFLVKLEKPYSPFDRPIKGFESISKEDANLLRELDEDEALEVSVQYLTDELDRLEKVCGSNILQDIFYECHDQGNAVTNLSAKFPDVRRSMDSIYEKYGFDIIYNELVG